jgi:hypothetical protein
MSSTLTTPPPTPRRPHNDQLARLALEHIADEEAQLQEALATLHDVRAALLGRDPAAVGNTLARQEECARRAEEMRRRRATFQQQAAELLGVPPESVNLDLLAVNMPRADAERLVAEQARLRGLAAEVGRVNGVNATLLYHCLDFFRRFFDDLTGGPRDGRYGPAGALAAAPCGSLINARG